MFGERQCQQFYLMTPKQDQRSADDDPVKALCALLDESGARVVFWVCQDCPIGRVTWKRANGKSTPRCEQCGKEGLPR